MRNRYRMMISAGLAGLVGLLAACEQSATGPSGVRRTENITATASVPANPTAPVTIQTYDPQSQVSITFDVATLQLFTAAAGGAATLALTDLAPKNYAQAPAGFRSVVTSADTIVAIYLISVTSAASKQVGAADRVFDTQPQGSSVVWTITSTTLPACHTYTVSINTTDSQGTTSGWQRAAPDLHAADAAAKGTYYVSLPPSTLNVQAIAVMISCSISGGVG